MFKLNKERIGLEKLDSGNYGAVFPYQKDPDDLKWVVKRIHANDADEVLNSLPEIVLGFSCDHPCIVPLKGYNIQKGSERDYYVYLKFPRMKESLEKRFKDQQRKKIPFSEKEIIQYFYSLVSAVDYLHSKKIYHRDIKPANVLLDHQGNARLCDIGVAKYVGEEEIYQQLTGQGGTAYYTAPEMLQQGQLTKESLRANDVWSVGLVLLELCALDKRIVNPLSGQEKILETQDKKKKELKEVYAEKLVDLIFELLKLDPNERMKIADVKKKLEEEYSCCQDFEGDSENKRRFEEKYKKANEEMMALVESLQQENLKLQNKLKEYQSSVKNAQSQTGPDLSKRYDEIIKRLIAKNESLMSEAAQKNQELERKKREIVPMITISLRSLMLLPDGVGYDSVYIWTSWMENCFLDPSKMKQGEVKFRLLFDRCLRYKGCDDFFAGRYEIFLAFYDISKKESFPEIQSALDDGCDYNPIKKGAIAFLIGVKSEPDSQRQVTKLEAKAYAKEIGAIHFEFSAKTEGNILDFQEELMKAIFAYDKPYAGIIEKKETPT